MIIRKNISLNEEYLKKLEPLMQKHNGNLSAVIRDVIDLADVAFRDPDSVKKLIKGIKKEQNLTSATLNWALKNLAGRLPEEEVVHSIIGDNTTSFSSLEKRLNELGEEMYWNTSVKIKADDENLPNNIFLTIAGKNQDMSRFMASIIAIFAAKKYNFGVSKIRTLENSLEMEMKKSGNGWIPKSLVENFGYMDCAFSELHKKPHFWNTIINLYLNMDYDMVMMSRSLFNEILGGKTSLKATACFERFYGCPINQVSFDDFIKKMKMLYEPMGIIKNMELNKDSIVIHHGLTEPEAIKKLAALFVELIKLNGHTYRSDVGENLIILKPQPKVDAIFVKILEELKNNNSPGNLHTNIVKILDVLKSMSFNESFTKSQGVEIGKILIQLYEKNKAIDDWNANTFAEYMQEASAILKQDSKWEVIGENMIHGKISACPLARTNGDINITNCTFIEGLLDGWISHAFNERADRIYRERSQINNKFCEIYVAV